MSQERDLHGTAQSLFRYSQGTGPIKFKDFLERKEPTPEEAQRMIDKFNEQFKHYEPYLKAIAKEFDVKVPDENEGSRNPR